MALNSFIEENGVALKSVSLDGKIVTPIFKFKLSGSVGDFAMINETEFILHLCYSEEKQSKTALVYVSTA